MTKSFPLFGPPRRAGCPGLQSLTCDSKKEHVRRRRLLGMSDLRGPRPCVTVLRFGGGFAQRPSPQVEGGTQRLGPGGRSKWQAARGGPGQRLGRRAGLSLS